MTHPASVRWELAVRAITPPGSSPPATLRGMVGLQVDDHLSKRLLDQVGGPPRD
jgi:hypothetical protein